MKETKVVIIGGTGDGCTILEMINQLASYGKPIKAVGFLNDELSVGFRIMDIPVLGNFYSWRHLSQDIYFIPALHKVKQMPERVNKIVSLGIPKDRWTTLIHPTAIIADNVTPSYGSFIGPYVVIQPEVQLGAFLSIRSGVAISHDCKINDFVYLGPKSSLSGRCFLDRGVHISPNVSVANNISIGAYSVVSLNTAVRKSVPDYALVMGNPGRIVQRFIGSNV